MLVYTRQFASVGLSQAHHNYIFGGFGLDMKPYLRQTLRLVLIPIKVLPYGLLLTTLTSLTLYHSILVLLGTGIQ